ncbi:MAG TPA: energy transducer TonB, partial [Myxococcales bacterium]|nr:energy transducer TonB [Myxococcales bacterium]
MVKPEREKDRRRKAWKRAALALVLTFAAHGLFAVMLAISSALWPAPPPMPAPQPVALRSLTSDQWDRNRKIGRFEVGGASQPVPEKKEEPSIHPDGQVVDVAPGNQQEAKDARYLAPTANAVEKETRAREQTALYRNAMSQRTRKQRPEAEGKDPVDQVMRIGTGGDGQDQASEADPGPQRAVTEIPSSRRQEEIRLRPEEGAGPGEAVANRIATRDLSGNSDRLFVQPGEATGGEPNPRGSGGEFGFANLTPSPGALDHITGAAPNDHLDVDEGDGTFLNT